MKQVGCEVFSRVVGYYRPVQNWNTGKQQEFKERQTYDISIGGGSCGQCKTTA